MLTENEALDRLKRAVDDEGTAKAWAERHGMSPSYVSDVLNGRRDISAKIMRPLGLRRVVTYEIAEASSAAALDPTSGGGAGGRSASPGAAPHGVGQ